MFPGVFLSAVLATPAAQELHVSQRLGEDATANGSAELPFRTLTAALAAVPREARGAATIRLEDGIYSAAAGERFPLELPGGLEVRGLGSGLTVLEGDGTGALLRVVPSPSPLRLVGLSLVAAERGIECPGTPAAPVSLVLQDVRLARLQTGLYVSAERKDDSVPAATVAVSGGRFEDCDAGVLLTGEGRVRCTVVDSTFRRNRNGIWLSGDTARGDGVDHDLVLQGCRFLDHQEAGLRRQGSDGRNRGVPYRIERCVFQGNDSGILFEIPAGDSPLLVRDCEFWENVHYGMWVAGDAGDAALRSTIRGSTFRWNGIALYLINNGVLFEVDGNQVLDSLGNGVFCANFTAAPTRVTFTNNVFAHNGTNGLHVMSDGHNVTARVAFNTFVGNLRSGVERKDRRHGVTTFEIQNCILAGNGADLRSVEEREVSHCLISDGQFAGVNGNFAADPGFVDPDLRDYHLRPDSPCRGRAGECPEAAEGRMDLEGRPRRQGGADLGALERLR